MDDLKKQGIITIVSVVLVSFVGELFGVNKLNIFYSAATCVVVTNVHFNELRSASINRAIGTVIGGVIGILFSYFDSSLFFKIIVGEIIIILICEKKLKIPSAVASLIFLSIIYKLTSKTQIYYGLDRIINTFIGILVTYFITSIFIKFEDDIDRLLKFFKL